MVSPMPVRRRRNSAARMALAAASAVAASISAKPALSGCPPASPVTDIMPLSACAAMSSPGRERDGPRVPKPLIAA
ncbi:hypothetical protein D3C72_1917570 [compost metagenome]